MKFIKILQKHKDASEKQIKDFIYRNMSEEMLKGLEEDDPLVIKRALKLFGVEGWDPDHPKKASEKKEV